MVAWNCLCKSVFKRLISQSRNSGSKKLFGFTVVVLVVRNKRGNRTVTAVSTVVVVVTVVVVFGRVSSFVFRDVVLNTSIKGGTEFRLRFLSLFLTVLIRPAALLLTYKASLLCTIMRL